MKRAGAIVGLAMHQPPRGNEIGEEELRVCEPQLLRLRGGILSGDEVRCYTLGWGKNCSPPALAHSES